MSQSPLVVFPEHEEPIRAELFSVERLEQHAESLAAAQTVTETIGEGRPFIPRRLGERPRSPRILPSDRRSCFARAGNHTGCRMAHR